jgi:hypothetical protein
MDPDAALPPTPPLRRTRRWWRRIALGLLAILAVTEVGLRFAGWFILRARAAGVPVVLVGYHLAPNYEDPIIARVTAEEGVPYIATGIPPQERRPELFTADGWHPSALEHRRMAERIAAVVGPMLIGNATQQERGPAAGGD